MTATKDIVLTRTFDAPVEAVWRAWTDPQLIVQWWGPTGFTSDSATVDLREGGKYVWNMRAPDLMGGIDMYTAGVYTRVEPNSLLEFTQWLADSEGNPVDPATTGMPADFPLEVRSAIRLTDDAGKTHLTAIEYDWAVGQQRDLSEAGLSECLDKLEDVLSRVSPSSGG